MNIRRTLKTVRGLVRRLVKKRELSSSPITSDSLGWDEPYATPVPEHRRPIYEFYRLTFDTNGCPMKLVGNRKIFHPMYPAYLIVDYYTMFKQTSDNVWIDQGLKLAELALQKAEYLKDSMVFYYRESEGLSSVPGTYYSALAQAWNIKAFSVLYPFAQKRGCGEDYKKALCGLYKSLTTPIEEGGVLIHKPYGWLVEEYPHHPPFYTLNGWLTVVRIIRDNGDVFSKIGIDVNEFLVKNMDSLAHLLPLYDAGFVFNSRYQLTGFTRIKFVVNRPTHMDVRAFSVVIADEGEFNGALSPQNSRWQNYLERKEPRLIQFNIVLSKIGHPIQNRFKMLLDIDKDCSVDVFLADGEWSPDITAMPTNKWRKIATETMVAGSNSIDISLPSDEKDLYAYPTNFVKKIRGRNFNAYHFIHIIVLSELYAHSGRDIFKEYALRWLKYTESWPSMKELQDSRYSFDSHCHGYSVPSVVHRNIEKFKPWHGDKR